MYTKIAASVVEAAEKAVERSLTQAQALVIGIELSLNRKAT